MKLRIYVPLVALALALLTNGPAAAATPPQPTAAMMKPVNALLQALDTQSAAPVRGMFTHDAEIVDEFPPFVWVGANAGEEYLASFKPAMSQAEMSHITGRINKVIEFQAGGNRAYICLATTITAMHGGKPAVERGVWTFVIEQSGAGWIIRTVTWSTANPM